MSTKSKHSSENPEKRVLDYEGPELSQSELEGTSGGAKIPYTQGHFVFQVDGAGDLGHSQDDDLTQKTRRSD